MYSDFFKNLKSQKKGVSGVVTAVLLILLVVAAVGILWAVVQSLVSDSTGNVGSSTLCLTNTFSIESAVNDSTITTVKIKKTQGSDEITSINFFIDGVSKTATTGTVPSLGETQSFNITGVGSEVEIAPVLGETQCPNSDKATITTAS
ncbi:hypothetical protein COU53_03640 [Candidatus Pacearchaeota archaeon CG10_big_fil_rev_8_21_14_0_10_30_48]|nr:MAG: hypothetical protein COU53_03640 [Candidatus Pacearchaeota archaeon CG10_big_fil_rev_8_21_14_0_10_30_48]